MFKVTIKNGNQETIINDNRQRLLTGQIKKGTNDISSFTFSILPDNAGYNLINPVTTRVKVERTDINKTLFKGRVWKPKSIMSDSGAFTKEFTCNDSLDYLHDIYPGYSTYKGTVRDIVGALLDFYNSLVEDYKKIYLGNVTSGNQLTLKTSAEKDLYDTIHEFVVTNLGYDHALRIENDKQYLDIGPTLGKQIDNSIKITKNLQSLSIEDDPSSLVTRVIPLGAVKETNTAETSEDTIQPRINLTDIGKKIYVDSPALTSKYGVQMGVMIYDTIKDANQLTAKAESYLKNQSITRGFTVDALDLSLIDKQVSDFECYNSYPVINPVMGLNEYLRVIDQTIDIINPQNAELGFGNKFKKASDYTLENLKVGKEAQTLKNTVGSLKTKTNDLSQQTADLTEQTAEVKKKAEEVASSQVIQGTQITGQSKQISELNNLVKELQDQINADGYYAGSIIDVSEFQGTINWPNVVKSGLALATIRVQSGSSHIDETYASNIPNAISAGANYAVYAYFSATSTADAEAEAVDLYNRTQTAVGTKKQPRFYMIDVEVNSVTVGTLKEAVTTYMNKLNSLGVADSKLVIYVSNDLYPAIDTSRTQIWIPSYGADDGTIENSIKPLYPYDLWQYTSKGSIAGITGDVDMSTEPSARFKESFLKK